MNKVPSWWGIALRAAIIPAFLIGFALWLGNEYRLSAEIRKDIQQSTAQRQKIEKLFSLMQDAETGQRGYVITGNLPFLDPYINAKAQIPARLGALATTVSGDPEEKEQLARLTSLVNGKLTEMQVVLDLRNSGGFEAAAKRVSDNRGKILMDQIRVVVARLIATENAALKTKIAAFDDRNSQIQRIIWAIIILVTVLMCVLGYLMGRDGRARIHLAREREDAAGRQKAIFDSVTDGIVMINPSGSIETINPAAERMFGYKPDELLRRDISTLVDIAPGDGLFLDRLGFRNGVLQHSALIGIAGRQKDGSPVHVDVVLGGMPLPDGIHIVAALRDVSERKEVERMKDEFISTVSHELRTPLTSVLGSLSLLRSGAAGEMPPQAQRLTVIAENNCQRLIRLINDILDIDKIQAGTMAFDYAGIDLRDVATRAVQAMDGLADQNGVTIASKVPEEPITVRADLERLVQVTTNLLSNAVRYSPPGSTVTVEVSAPDGIGIVHVKDQGPGISEEFKKQIFNRFAQGARPESQVIEGTGLGLAISREIVRNHGGEIWFDNRPEGGACFSFSVPRWEMFDFAGTKAHQKLLICEDDPDAAEIIRAILAARDLEADVVHTAQDARAGILRGQYAALLLDLRLPDGNGIDVIRTIRSTPSVSNLPIIIISGSEPKSSVPPGSIDIIDWIEKPVQPSRLTQAVEIALARSRSTQPVILHVEDDGDTLEIFATALANRGRVVGVRNLASARAFLDNRTPDVVILDLGLPDGSGAELLPALVDKNGDAVPTIIYSAQDVSGEIQRSVDAVLTKSRRTLPGLVATVTRILENEKTPADL